MDSCEALERKLDVLMREPGEARHYNETGVWLYRQKDFDNARKYLERAYALRPEDADILYNYASVLYALADWEGCAAVFERLLRLEPENKKVWEQLAYARYCMGDYASAEECIKKPLKTE